jgi:hypothetical protein
MILSLIRKRTDATTDERFAVNEKYPVETVRQPEELPSLEKFVQLKNFFKKSYLFLNRLIEILKNTKENESIKKVLNPLLRTMILFHLFS